MQMILPPPRLPSSAIMSANWTDEGTMRKLFVEGLKSGVRCFDTAREYKSEKQIGRALKWSLDHVGLKREEIFVQTRISNFELKSKSLLKEIEKSNDNLGLGYIDCFMFHWPTPNIYIEKWRELIDIFKGDNRVRAIGLCNCRIRHLQKLLNEGVEMLPQILQVEVQPFWQATDLKRFCDEYGILLQAFSPLCKMIEPIRNNPTLLFIAEKHNVTVPQIILKWHIQRGVFPITLTRKVERVGLNFNLSFELSDNDMSDIAQLDCGYKYHLESSTCIGF